MSANSEITERLLAGLHETTPDTLREARRGFAKTTLIRRCIAIEAEKLITTKRGMLESCSELDLKKHQGEISGIKQLLAAIDALGTL